MSRAKRRDIRQYLHNNDPTVRPYQLLNKNSCDSLKLSQQMAESADLRRELDEVLLHCCGLEDLIEQLKYCEDSRETMERILREELCQQEKLQDLNLILLGTDKQNKTFINNLRLLLQNLMSVAHCFQHLHSHFRLLSVLSSSNVRIIRHSSIQYLSYFVEVLLDSEQLKSKKKTLDLLEVLLRMVEQRQKDVDSSIRLKCSRIKTDILKSQHAFIVPDNIKSYIGESLSQPNLRMLKQLMESSKSAGIVIADFIFKQYESLIQASLPRLIKNKSTGQYQHKVLNKGVTVMALALVRNAVRIFAESGKKFRKNREIVDLVRRMSLGKQRDLEVLLSEIIEARKISKRDKQVLQLHLFKLVKFIGKVNAEESVISQESEVIKMFAELHSDAMPLYTLFQFILNQEIKTKSFRHQLNSPQQIVLAYFAMAFYRHALGKSQENAKGQLREVLLSYSKQIFYNKLSQQNELIQILIQFYFQLDCNKLRSQDNHKILSLIQILQTAIYCKKNVNIVRKAAKLITAFAKAVLPARQCLVRIISSFSFKQIQSSGEQKLGFEVLFQVSEQMLPQQIGLQIPDLSECIKHYDSLQQESRINLVRAILNFHNLSVMKIVKSHQHFEFYKDIKVLTLQLANVLIHRVAGHSQEELTAFSFICQVFSVLSNDKFTSVKFILVEPPLQFLQKLILSLKQSLQRIQSQDPLNSLSLDFSPIEMFDFKFKPFAKLVKASSQISKNPVVVQFLYDMACHKNQQLADKAVQALMSNSEKELNKDYERMLPLWQTIQELVVLIAVRRGKAQVLGEWAKIITKQIFYRKKSGQVQLHITKMVLFIADCIQKFSNQKIFVCFLFLQKLVSLNIKKIGPSIARRLLMFAQNKFKSTPSENWQKDTQFFQRFCKALQKLNVQEIAQGQAQKNHQSDQQPNQQQVAEPAVDHQDSQRIKRRRSKRKSRK